MRGGRPTVSCINLLKLEVSKFFVGANGNLIPKFGENGSENE